MIISAHIFHNYISRDNPFTALNDEGKEKEPQFQSKWNEALSLLGRHYLNKTITTTQKGAN